jgi:hypothetical protein
MRDHLAGLAAEARDAVDLRAGDIVIDIGSNDGTSLRCYADDVRKVGVDPSNIEPLGADVHVNDYFSHDAVRGVLGDQKAKIITSIAMFYDLNDPQAFVRDIQRCLSDDGVWILELSYLPTMLETNSFDTICHEHVCYYRIATFERVLLDSGLQVFDVDFNRSNGGSFRLFVAPVGRRPRTSRFDRAKAEEGRSLFDRELPYRQFRSRVEQVRDDLQIFLSSAATDGHTVYGYGASTKGMVTLQYCEVTREQVPAIAERNAQKYGLLTPGTDIPICSEAEMREFGPDYLLALPWHFIDEFRRRERAYQERGGRFVMPLPEFEVLGWRED